MMRGIRWLFAFSPAQVAAARALPHGQAATWIATWFGIGLMPRAPGSWGSFAALPFGLIIAAYGGVWLLLAACAVVALLGLWATARILPHTKEGDPGLIVVDEVAGMWIALLPCGINPWLTLLAFMGFRIFDILKPGPIGWLERNIPGAAGIMADDLAAGVMAALCCLLFSIALGI